MTLLDIGGGIGAIQHALMPPGVISALDVDASAAYLAAAGEEAERLGLAERIRFVHGNFVELASTIPPRRSRDTRSGDLPLPRYASPGEPISRTRAEALRSGLPP